MIDPDWKRVQDAMPPLPIGMTHAEWLGYCAQAWLKLQLDYKGAVKWPTAAQGTNVSTGPLEL